MANKIYVSANDYLRDSWRLARMILDSGWQPDDLIALWRGGAPVGVSVHEFLHYHGQRPRHRVLKCQSYTGIRERSRRVVFEGAEAIFASIVRGSRVLVIDDVLDTGNTARAMFERLAPFGADVRLATVYWKPSQSQPALKPDYYVRETDDWIVFPHELDGLTPEEIKLKDPVVYSLLAHAPAAFEGGLIDLDAVIRKVPDFPKPGILFYDVSSIFTNPAAFAYVVDQMVAYYKDFRIDGVVAIESRGFLVAGAYCCRTRKPLTLARKKGRLPGKTIAQSYALEYGEATLEMHTEDIVANHRYLIIDDLVATGGTIEAVAAMLTRQNAQVAAVFSIIGLPFLPYKSKLAAFDVKTLIEYHAE